MCCMLVTATLKWGQFNELPHLFIFTVSMCVRLRVLHKVVQHLTSSAIHAVAPHPTQKNVQPLCLSLRSLFVRPPFSISRTFAESFCITNAHSYMNFGLVCIPSLFLYNSICMYQRYISRAWYIFTEAYAHFYLRSKRALPFTLCLENLFFYKHSHIHIYTYLATLFSESVYNCLLFRFCLSSFVFVDFKETQTATSMLHVGFRKMLENAEIELKVQEPNCRR